MKKLVLILTTILLIITPIAIAQESANIETSYDWLRKQELTSIFDASLAALALNNVDTTSAQPIIQWIQEQQDPTLGCFPAGACTIKDTSLAMIILSNENYDISLTKQWLLEQQKLNTLGGVYLQVITSNTGKCNIEYKSKDSQIWESKEINIDAGEISSTACPTKSTFFNLGTCLKSGLLEQNPSLPVKILCRDLSDAKLSLVYKDSNSYYLIYSTQSNTIEDLTLNMGYFTNYEDTLYANWALKNLGSEINSITWLKKQFSPGNIRDNALIYILSEQEPYIHNLLTLQNTNTGSFGSAFETGLACLALTQYGTYGTEAEQARKFLDSRQFADGSWNNKITDTAMALYGCYSSAAVSLQPCTGSECYPSITTGISTEPECYIDSDCLVDEQCIDGTCQIPTTEICNYDGYCDVDFGEDEYNCPTDCESTITEPPEEEPGYEPFVEDKEKGGWFWFIVIVLILILLLGAVYYFLIMKSGKKLSDFIKFKKRKPTPRPAARPAIRQVRTQRRPIYRPARKAKPTRIETELKKSLEEAKKLLKKR